MSTACIVEGEQGPPPDPIGNLSFDWSFAGQPDCASANVADVTVILSQGGEVVFERDNEACFGGGLTIEDIDTGTYDVDVTAFSDAGDALFHGSFTADIPDDHRTVNAGLIDLQSTDQGPPPVGQGTLSFFWAFHYPTDAQTVDDCALAGVDSVDVTVTPQGGETAAFTQTSTCDAQHQGLTIDNLDAGNYSLHMTAHGSFNGGDVVLYDSGDVPVSVNDSTTTDLGNVVLGRVASGFSDFNVSWAFADGSSCADGEQITLSFQRDNESSPEDSFSTDCSSLGVVRRTFVPGHYTVTGVSSGTPTYAASAGVDLPPNNVADVSLSLTPQ